MSSNQSSFRKRVKIERESDKSSTIRKSSAYDSDFEQHLIDHDVYPYKYDYDDDDDFVYSDNWKEINERLAQSRSSLSPSRFSREAFWKFEKINMQTLTENAVMSKAFPIIADIVDVFSQKNILFENLKDLTDDSITKAKPDFYDESRSTELNRQIRKKLSFYIVPSTNIVASCLLNFFTKGKDSNENAAICKRQALYDDAVSAREMHELRSYVDSETTYDNNAYTITSTYHGDSETLIVYTTHLTLFKDIKRSIEYCMTQLNLFVTINNSEIFRQETTLLRNVRELTKEKREELIAATNGKVLDAKHSDLMSFTQSFVSLSSNESVNSESETLTDELALSTNTCARSTHRTSVEARINSSSKISSNRLSKKKLIRVDRESDTGYEGVQKI